MPQSLEPEERRDHKPNSSTCGQRVGESEWARAKVQQIARRANQPGQPLSSNAWMGVRANVEEREKPQMRATMTRWPKAHLRVFEIKKNSIGSEPPDIDDLFASFEGRNVQHRVRVFAAVFAQYAEVLKRARRACG